MENKAFDDWLAGLELSFWGTAQHKVTAELKPGKVYKRPKK